MKTLLKRILNNLVGILGENNLAGNKICQLFRIVTLSFFQNKCNKILLQAGDVELFSFYVRVAQVEISGSTFWERSCQSNFVGSLVNALKASISDKKITESLKIEK